MIFLNDLKNLNMESIEKKPFYKTNEFIIFIIWFSVFAVLIGVKLIFL